MGSLVGLESYLDVPGVEQPLPGCLGLDQRLGGTQAVAGRVEGESVCRSIQRFVVFQDQRGGLLEVIAEEKTGVGSHYRPGYGGLCDRSGHGR